VLALEHDDDGMLKVGICNGVEMQRSSRTTTATSDRKSNMVAGNKQELKFCGIMT
jgi:hypothetical protein